MYLRSFLWKETSGFIVILYCFLQILRGKCGAMILYFGVSICFIMVVYVLR